MNRFDRAMQAVLTVLVTASSVSAQSNGVSIGRVKVSQSDSAFTVRTADDHLLRGGVVAVFKQQREQAKASDRPDQAFDEEYWDAMKRGGLNAVRLVFFDAWQRSHGSAGTRTPYPHADLNDPRDVDALLVDLDQAVAMAEKRQMHLLINYHDTGGYRDPDHSRPAGGDRHFPYQRSTAYLTKFWELVAPRYRDKTHVFYELTNEPVTWHPNDYTADHIQDFAKLYSRVRLAAPDTHLVLCSFATIADFGRSMTDVANDLVSAGVSFDNASIGFHPYDISSLPHNESLLVKLMRRYPAINTEQNFPESIDDGTQDPDARGFGKDEFGVQSMERLGVSWFHWNITGNDEFKKNYLGILLPDAQAKGYLWSSD